MAEKIKINSGDFNRLKEAGLSDNSLKLLERAHNSGMRFVERADLELISLKSTDIDLILPKIDFTIPPPLVKFKRIDIKVLPVPLEGYSVRTESGGDRRLLPLSRDGRAAFSYIRESLGEFVRFSVHNAGGQRLDIDSSGGNTVPFLEINSDALKDVSISVRRTKKVEQAKDDTVRSARITGRLMGGQDHRRLEDIGIVFLAATATNPKPEDFFPITGTTTQGGGYFRTGLLVFPNPGDAVKLTAAKAVIGLDPVIEQPVHLLPATTGAGRLPERVILYIADTGRGAAKAGCAELDFHQRKPLDEFSYYTVIRTTEPAIQSYTINDAEEISLEEVVDTQEFPDLKGVAVRADILEAFISLQGGISKANLPLLLERNKLQRLRDKLRPPSAPRGRVLLDGGNAVDWDEKPTIYQATTIAHGHLLHFKQEWYSDGYSIGDLIYSLPLAPGQQKQIVVFDWDRRESASNTEQLDYQESLYGTLSRDRDVNEIARATVRESLSASSEASTSSIGWGAGGGLLGVIPADVPLPFGLLAGVAGGSGEGSSSASQTGSRTATSSSSQHVQDKTVQAATGVRSQRSTVIQTVSQGERFEVSAESVANYNHCHAMTMQYFEVLRHFMVQTRLADVQECLFIPLKITPFDRAKALRWRESMQRRLRDRRLIRAFDALERVNEELSGSDNYYDAIGFPAGRYAAEEIEYLDGELYIEFQLVRPSNDDDDKFVPSNWNHLAGILGTPLDFYNNYLKQESKRDEVFMRVAGPRVAEEALKALRLECMTTSFQAKKLPVDFTLLSGFRNRVPLNISIRLHGQPGVKREAITFVRLSIPQGSMPPDLQLLFSKTLKLIIRGGSIRYRTANLSSTLFRDLRINNDLDLNSDAVLIPTPMSQAELRNPRAEDVEVANALLNHLNDNLEYYHQCIWHRMDPQRRYMLLDGLIAPGRAEGRSVASVVENKLIGIVGNTLIMPVAAGFHLDPNLREDVDLFEHYYEDPLDPARLSLPTKGVFAEAVLGSCNSCELIEDDRYWRWDEAPIPNKPTDISAVTVPTPGRSEPDLSGRDFPSPVVNIQNAPDLPEPQGFGGLAQLIGKGDLFRDITGLTENQKNALAALQQAFKSSEFFAGQAAELTKIAAKAAYPDVKELSEAKAKGLTTQERAREIYEEGVKQRSQSDQASQIIKERETVEKAVRENTIDRAEAERIYKELRELRESMNKSTLERLEKQEVIKDSTRIEVKDGKGGETRVERTPGPKPRTIRFAVFILDPYGKPFSFDSVPATSIEMAIASAHDSTSVTLTGSGTELGAVLEDVQPDGGTISIHLMDETDSAGNIAFTGVGDVNIAPTAVFVRVTAAMDTRKQKVVQAQGETKSRAIAKKLDLSLGAKLSAGLKGSLAKALEASAGLEESLGVTGGVSVTDTAGTSGSTSTEFEVRIPTENLTVSVR